MLLKTSRSKERDVAADMYFHMNFGRVLLGLVCVLSAAISPLTYSATRVVFQDELLSETQSNVLIGTGDVAFSKQDYGTAMQSYVAASGDKDPVVRAGALNRIGVLYERALGVPQDYGRAREYFLKAADLGNGHAQANVGDLYFFGLNVPRNIAEALKWYRKGADQDAPLGLNQTGWSYLQGIGARKDPSEAMKWYRRSADLGSPNAAYELGWIYGHVEPMDYTQAMTWYRKAASHNHVEAQNNIGTLFEKGLGVPQDYAQAAHWYQLASSVGYARSQFHLGELYFTGRGVKQDATTARALMVSAAHSGDLDAQEWLHLHP
jgi:TPR repeat protein